MKHSSRFVISYEAAFEYRLLKIRDELASNGVGLIVVPAKSVPPSQAVGRRRYWQALDFATRLDQAGFRLCRRSAARPSSGVQPR